MNNIKLTLVLFFGIIFQILGQNTYDFLQLDSSPRASSLAGSYIADNLDPNVIFYNPAGITTIENIPISFSFLKYLADINSVSLASTFNVQGIGKFGSALRYINYGKFEERDESGNELGTFNPSDLALTIAYGNSFSEKLTYGASIKFIYSNIASASSFGIAGDIGMQYMLPENGWNFGVSLLNMGSQLSYYNQTNESLPFSVQLGASKKLTHTPLQLFFALTRLNDADRFKFINVGIEFTMSKVIQLRFGYDNVKREEYKIASTSALGGFSFGLGIDVSDYDVDYSFSSMGSIGAAHRIGITSVIK
ncbi:MAG: type IX secretion system protein PorQ [Bacteroidetes bacterium]|nr:type IX secretion system protein PorQ [Bacteroidota bacterium]MBU1116876.1 type IX secretion system protein PorQ [Bacteroidota bacterium]MBU1797446.1 type IX secretion system protein PorQ [Bacteroidota bacterium]